MRKKKKKRRQRDGGGKGGGGGDAVSINSVLRELAEAGLIPSDPLSAAMTVPPQSRLLNSESSFIDIIR
jgi:hypothetical protein